MSYLPLMTYEEAVAMVSAPALPEETKSYKPVENAKLFDTVRSITSDYLGKEPSSYGATLNRKGTQMFGSVIYQNGAEDMAMQIGFRNSYDKSMPVGLIAGAVVKVCSNGMFIGDIASVRRHTVNVWRDIEDMIQRFSETIVPNYETIQKKKGVMQECDVTKRQGAELLGVMFVEEDILTTPMLNIAKKEWLEPSHEDFNCNDAWSLYNACTEAFKVAHPTEIMERHQQLDGFFSKTFLPF